MTAIWRRGLIGSVVAAVVMGGCGGGGVTQPSGTPTPAPRAAVRGRALVDMGDAASPLAGATVSVVGANPAITTTSAGDGTFSLDVPVGVAALRVIADGHWGALVVIAVP